MAYGFYHLAKMLLATYRPYPRFAIRNAQYNVSGETDRLHDMAQLTPF